MSLLHSREKLDRKLEALGTVKRVCNKIEKEKGEREMMKAVFPLWGDIRQPKRGCDQKLVEQGGCSTDPFTFFCHIPGQKMHHQKDPRQGPKAVGFKHHSSQTEELPDPLLIRRWKKPHRQSNELKALLGGHTTWRRTTRGLRVSKPGKCKHGAVKNGPVRGGHGHLWKERFELRSWHGIGKRKQPRVA